MPDFDPTQFGITMGQLVAEYRAAYAWLAPLPHVATLLLLYALFRYGQRARKAFTLYFILTYVWAVIFVGGWFSVQLYRRLGLPALGMYGATPILLLLILYQWVQELRMTRLDLDFTKFDNPGLSVRFGDRSGRTDEPAARAAMTELGKHQHLFVHDHDGAELAYLGALPAAGASIHIHLWNADVH